MLEDMPGLRHMLARISPSLFGLRRSDVAPRRRGRREGAARIGLDVPQIPLEISEAAVSGPPRRTTAPTPPSDASAPH
jgi:hypothetical protein